MQPAMPMKEATAINPSMTQHLFKAAL